MDRPEERTSFCKRYRAHTVDDLFTCFPPAQPLGFTEAVDGLERSIQHNFMSLYAFRAELAIVSPGHKGHLTLTF